MNILAETIKEYFKRNDWTYTYYEEYSLFRFGIRMDSVIGSLDYIIAIRKDAYTVYAILRNKVEQEYISQVAEFLHRANYGMHVGNFELDYDDGEIRYKNHIEIETEWFCNTDKEISDAMLSRSITIPAAMFKKYGKGLLELMVGEGDPEKLIDSIEHTDVNDE